jgi:hypothetical protein
MPKAEVNYPKEIDSLITSIIRMSSLASGMSTTKEQQQMDGKKASFYIKDIDKRYTFIVSGNKVEITKDMDQISTYVVCSSAKLFLETIDKILAGDVGAFQRAIQRGELILKGPQSLHDQLMWKKGLERLHQLRKVYGMA